MRTNDRAGLCRHIPPCQDVPVDTTWDDITFLREFRALINEFLVLGYAPTERIPNPPPEVLALEKRKGFEKLRERLNRSIPRATRLLAHLGVKTQMTEYPVKGSEGQVLRFDLFDLVVRNRTFKDLDRLVFVDRIDQALGLLEVRVDKGLIRRPAGAPDSTDSGTMFVAMTVTLEDPDQEDVFDAIKSVADEMGLEAIRLLIPDADDVVTPRVRHELESAEFVVVDLTRHSPALYWQAGLVEGMGRDPVLVARQGMLVDLELPDCPVLYFVNLHDLRDKLKARLSLMR